MRRENKSCSKLQGSFLMFWKTVRVLLLSAASHRLLRWIELLITFAKHFQFSLASTGLMVVKSAVLHKDYRMDFHKTWIEDGYWPKMDPINSRKRDRSRVFFLLSLTLLDGVFFGTFVLFIQGIMHGSGTFRWVQLDSVEKSSRNTATKREESSTGKIQKSPKGS